MPKYTFILEDMPNGSVAVSVPEKTKFDAMAIAAGTEQRTPAFDYLIACMNTLHDRSRGISRDAEKRTRDGILPSGLIIPG